MARSRIKWAGGDRVCLARPPMRSLTSVFADLMTTRRLATMVV